jgi:hypothetical protein
MVRVQVQSHCDLNRDATTHKVTITVIIMVNTTSTVTTVGVAGRVVGTAGRAVGGSTNCCRGRLTLGILRDEVVVGAELWA